MFKASQILTSYGVALIFLGALGNSLIAYVSLRNKSHTIFALLRYLALTDTLALVFWNLNHFTGAIFEFDLMSYNLYMCKIGEWIQYSSMQASAWLLVRRKFKLMLICIWLIIVAFNFERF